MNPTDCPIPIYSYTDNTPIYTKNVFANNNDDKSIRYKPYCNKLPIGDAMENMFQKKCSKTTNAFFYPDEPEKFFNKHADISSVYQLDYCNDNVKFYNNAWNQRHVSSGSQKLYTDCTNQYTFFNNNSGPIYPNKCMKRPLTKTDKYISAYDKSVDRFTCKTLPCDLSFCDSAAI